MILDHIGYNVRLCRGGSGRRLGDCGAFFIDPDGNNIEAVCHHAE